RQCQRSENLGDGSNFEDRISIERAWIAAGEIAIGDDVPAIRFDHSRDNADRLLLMINAFYEDFADFLGAKNCNRVHKFERLHLCPLKETHFGYRAETRFWV